MIKINFDGACGPVNPGGKCGGGAVIIKDGQLVAELSARYEPKEHGNTSNNVGEYFALNIAYCFRLKNVPYVDVMSIALGFVLRVLAGAAGIAVPVSPWLLGCTALLSMFLGFGKRAHEIASSSEATKQRSVLAHYKAGVLNGILYSLAVATVVVYALYTQSEHVAQMFGDAPLLYTVPFPALGIIRFIYLVTTRHEAESPTEEMLRDVPFMLNFVAWLVVTALLLYGVI